MQTRSLVGRVKRIEGRRHRPRHLNIVFELPVGVEMGDPGVQELLEQIARRDVPEIEFSRSTSVFMITDWCGEEDTPRVNDLTTPRVVGWYVSELTHEEALDELEKRFPRTINGKPVNNLVKLRAPYVEDEGRRSGRSAFMSTDALATAGAATSGAILRCGYPIGPPIRA